MTDPSPTAKPVPRNWRRAHARRDRSDADDRCLDRAIASWHRLPAPVRSHHQQQQCAPAQPMKRGAIHRPACAPPMVRRARIVDAAREHPYHALHIVASGDGGTPRCDRAFAGVVRGSRENHLPRYASSHRVDSPPRVVADVARCALKRASTGSAHQPASILRSRRWDEIGLTDINARASREDPVAGCDFVHRSATALSGDRLPNGRSSSSATNASGGGTIGRMQSGSMPGCDRALAVRA